jgi:hypothetical protein
MSDPTKIWAGGDSHEQGIKANYKHRRRGTTYTVLGRAVLQTDLPLADNHELVVYAGADGRLWARPSEEFFDGRFEVVDAPCSESKS